MAIVIYIVHLYDLSIACLSSSIFYKKFKYYNQLQSFTEISHFFSLLFLGLKFHSRVKRKLFSKYELYYYQSWLNTIHILQKGLQGSPLSLNFFTVLFSQILV